MNRVRKKCGREVSRKERQKVKGAVERRGREEERVLQGRKELKKMYERIGLLKRNLLQEEERK